MNLEIALPCVSAALYAVLMLVEHFNPGRSYPERRSWRLQGWLFFVGVGSLGTGLLMLVRLDERFADASVVDLSHLGAVPGGIVGYLAYSFVHYWWHRWQHTNATLWRWVHQMHHAPVRMDLGGLHLVHPIEYVVLAVLISAIGVALHLGPASILLVAFLANLWSHLGHMNVRTPRWLGYFVQRPEAHELHHLQRNVFCNFGDMPLWDLLFGTFRNPEGYSHEPVGIADADGRDRDYLPMLLGRDIRGSRASAPRSES